VTTPTDRGSITIVTTAVLVIGVSLSLRLGDLGDSLVRFARAQSIADASALAGVYGSRVESARIAVENGAVLVRYEESTSGFDGGSTVRVTIELDGRLAEAWASDEG